MEHVERGAPFRKKVLNGGRACRGHLSRWLGSALAVGASGASAVAYAQPVGEFTGSLTFLSDYVFRGVSQTQEEPAMQGVLDYVHPTGVYAGVFGSNVNLFDGEPDEPSLEIDVYVGYAGAVGPVGYNVFVTRFTYPDGSNELIEDFNEYHADLSYSIVTVGVDYANDAFGSGADSLYLFASAEIALNDWISAHGLAGVYSFDEDVFGSELPDSYIHYVVGLSASAIGLDWDVRFEDTDDDAATLFGEDIVDERVVFSVGKSF